MRIKMLTSIPIRRAPELEPELVKAGQILSDHDEPSSILPGLVRGGLAEELVTVEVSALGQPDEGATVDLRLGLSPSSILGLSLGVALHAVGVDFGVRVREEELAQVPAWLRVPAQDALDVLARKVTPGTSLPELLAIAAKEKGLSLSEWAAMLPPSLNRAQGDAWHEDDDHSAPEGVPSIPPVSPEPPPADAASFTGSLEEAEALANQLEGGEPDPADAKDATKAEAVGPTPDAKDGEPEAKDTTAKGKEKDPKKGAKA